MPIEPDSALIVVDLQNDFLPPSGSLAVPDGRDVIAPIVGLLDVDKYNWKAIVATRDFHPQDHCSFASNWNQEPFTPRVFKHPLQEVDPRTKKVKVKEQILWPDHCVQATKGSEFTDEFSSAFGKLVKQHTVTTKEPGIAEVRKGYLTDREYYSAFEDAWELHTTELDGFLKDNRIKNVYLVGLAYDFCVLNTAISGAKRGYNTFVLQDCAKSVYPEKLSETDELYRANNVHLISSKDLT